MKQEWWNRCGGEVVAGGKVKQLNEYDWVRTITQKVLENSECTVCTWGRVWNCPEVFILDFNVALIILLSFHSIHSILFWKMYRLFLYMISFLVFDVHDYQRNGVKVHCLGLFSMIYISCTHCTLSDMWVESMRSLFPCHKKFYHSLEKTQLQEVGLPKHQLPVPSS